MITITGTAPLELIRKLVHEIVVELSTTTIPTIVTKAVSLLTYALFVWLESIEYFQ